MAAVSRQNGYILWGGGPSRSLLVELVLAEVGAPYELRDLDLYGGPHSMADFQAANPYGWIPMLETPDGQRLAETPAITTWLAEAHGSPLVVSPGQPGRAAYLSAFHYVIGEIEPIMKRIFFAHRFALRQEDTEAAGALAWSDLMARLAVQEKLLAQGGPWLAGAARTLADLHFGYWMRYVDLAGSLEDLPQVRAHSRKVRQLSHLIPIFDRLEATILEFYAKRAQKT